MAWPTIEEQHAAIQSDFPEFRLLGGAGWTGIWDGPVRPISKTYRIRIVFFRRRFFDGWTLDNPYVAVFVVDPVIGADAIKEERVLPHIYWNDQRPEYPRLCLYDPKEMTWTPEQLIATTIIPWASQWLFFYEYWQITGEFKGPGRHPERKSDRCQTPDENLDPAIRARRERFRNAEVPQAWPKNGKFRILSIDGGGIRGIFPAAVLAGLEREFIGGRSIASYFDLIAGTSTGGILALGLGAGYTAADLLELYVTRGNEIFPERLNTMIGRVKSWWRPKHHYLRYHYERDALERVLTDKLGDRLFGDSKSRLCIPAFEGKHSEVFVFKTPHHPDYKFDRFERMVTVGLATSAAPTYFRPLQHGGYTLVDGGVWANNPTMLAVVEALICFDVGRDRIDVLSLGCGDDPYVVSQAQIDQGGKLAWSDVVFAAMRLQSLAAVNQARLLLGPPSVIRIDAPTGEQAIALDDWRRAVNELPPVALRAIEKDGGRITGKFLKRPAEPYVPFPAPGP